MISTAAFIAGVGVLVTLDLAVLGISVVNARQVGTDEKARKRAAKAIKIARQAKRRATNDSRGRREDGA